MVQLSPDWQSNPTGAAQVDPNRKTRPGTPCLGSPPLPASASPAQGSLPVTLLIQRAGAGRHSLFILEGVGCSCACPWTLGAPSPGCGHNGPGGQRGQQPTGGCFLDHPASSEAGMLLNLAVPELTVVAIACSKICPVTPTHRRCGFLTGCALLLHPHREKGGYSHVAVGGGRGQREALRDPI